MPLEISAARSVFGISPKIIFLLIALLVIAAAIFMVRTGGKDFLGNLFPASGPTAELPLAPVQVPSPTSVTVVPTFKTDASASIATPAPIWISTGTTTPQPGETITPLPSPHGFEVIKIAPGSDQGYLVHVVAVGENLDKIAEHYNTTVPAILAVNYKLKPPVWAQYPLVIPVDAQDAIGLPALRAYVVEADESISAESLADVLGVDSSALELYNLCVGNCQFNKGDVLLIPYIQ